MKFREITNFLPVKCEMAVFPLMKRDPNPPFSTLSQQFLEKCINYIAIICAM